MKRKTRTISKKGGRRGSVRTRSKLLRAPKRPIKIPLKLPRDSDIPVVGIGASAGGLEALRELLNHIPKASPLVLVIIQHMSPMHKSVLTELLSRVTPLPIVEVKHNTKIERSHVYVISPNYTMTIKNGVLRLGKRPPVSGLQMSIDHFFRSLALDRKKRAIGVVLSGTATDGTEGLRAIKEEGGMTFAQSERTARFSGMPHSAITAGVVDLVLPPAKIAAELVRIANHQYTNDRESKERESTQGESAMSVALQQIIARVRVATGTDFSSY